MGARYCYPADIVNLSATATAPVGTVSTDPAYGLASLSDLNPARPCKFTTTGEARIVWTFGAAQAIHAFLLPSHNLDPGHTVALQANSVPDSWTDPPFDVAITIRAKDGDGHSGCPWVNCEAAGAHSYQYWSLSIASGNSVAPQIGEAVLAAELRAWDHGVLRDTVARVRRGYIPALETEYGVRLYYDQTVAQRAWEGTIVATEADLAELRWLVESARGPVKPFAFVPDDRLHTSDSIAYTDGGYLVRVGQAMSDAFEAAWSAPDVRPVAYAFEEVSRGLPL